MKSTNYYTVFLALVLLAVTVENGRLLPQAGVTLVDAFHVVESKYNSRTVRQKVSLRIRLQEESPKDINGIKTVNGSQENVPTTLITKNRSSLSLSHRRSFVVSAFSFGMMSGTLVGSSMIVNAKYGTSSNIELPNYIDYLIEQNTVRDESKLLYKGIDPSILLKRLQYASARLQDIEVLAEQKKWTQINGLVTGPLGTLSMTLNQIATPESSTIVKETAKKLKADVLAIGQAADKKNADACTKQAAMASEDLKTLLQAAFE